MSLWILIRLLIYGALLWGMARGLRLLVALRAPGSPRRRTLKQALPVVELILGALFALAIIRELFDGWAEAAGLLGLLFGGLWIARFALMDLVAGVVMRASGRLEVGDRVRIDGLEGRVRSLNLRGLCLDTRHGDEAQIPYSLLSRHSIVRSHLTRGSYPHSFRIDRSAAASPEQIRRLALLSHWSAVARPPVVELGPTGDCEVTVFAVAPERGPEIEAFLRGSLMTDQELGAQASRAAPKRQPAPPVA